MYFPLQTYQVYSEGTGSTQSDALLGYFIVQEIIEFFPEHLVSEKYSESLIQIAGPEGFH
jgi:hypothetical protein